MTRPWPHDPFSVDMPDDLTGATQRSIVGMRIAYTADYDVFPIDRRVAAVIDDAVHVLEEAGAHVEPVRLGLRRDQRELFDLWCRLMMPLNITAIEGFNDQGIDILRDSPKDLPPRFRE